jgi:hypothetical protein
VEWLDQLGAADDRGEFFYSQTTFVVTATSAAH